MKYFFVAWSLDRYIQNKIIDFGGEVDDCTAGHPKFHMTIINSPTYPTGRVYNSIDPTRYKAKITGIEYWESEYGKFTVAILDIPIAKVKHLILKRIGCTSHFDYRPHVTLKRNGDFTEQFQPLVNETFGFTSEYIQFLEM